MSVIGTAARDRPKTSAVVTSPTISGSVAVFLADDSRSLIRRRFFGDVDGGQFAGG